MFKLDLKRAEVAIKSGRLDQAFDVLASSPKANHADGQRLVERLAADYVLRANLHLENDRLETASMDANKAEQLAGQRIDIAELKARIVAKKCSLAGRARIVSSASAIQKLKSLVDSKDHEGAIRWLAENTSSDTDRYEFMQLAAVSAEQLQQLVKHDFDNGRLDRCEANLEFLFAAGFHRQESAEMKEQLDRCRLVLRYVRESKLGMAIQQLQLAAQVSTSAKWIDEAIEAISQSQKNLLATCSGPLGLLDQKTLRKPGFNQPEADLLKPNRQRIRSTSEGEPFQNANKARSDVLQVDQLGGVLLLRGDMISIGTPSIARLSDIVLQTEGLKAKIGIRRDGEDYFASSAEGFFVNNVLASSHVLSPGDTIAVGSRGRLKFVRPMPASNSVVLLVQGARLKRRDIRGIVLVDESVVFGDSGCHFSVPDLATRVIVQPAENDLERQYVIHEKGSSHRPKLVVGSSQDIAGVQFTLLPESPTSRERVS